MVSTASTSSIQKNFKYDVFLSFRGEDTRKNFVDHLYYALKQKSIHTYKDDEKIKKGKRICDDLIESIEDSKLYIIVFSKNYASSSWCLEELVKIMECQKTNEHTAYPIFYDVEPTEIRKLSGSVGEAFTKHEKDESAGKWRDALQEAANLAGWELKNTNDGHEANFIQKIVQEISVELSFTNSRVYRKLIGMETRVADVISSLEIGAEKVSMIGIKGMGGGGKTTLARAVFDQISVQFEGKSFVDNVREVSKASISGLKKLQKQVLSDVSNDRKITVSSVHDGKNKMRKIMCGRKVLIVLDDVDHLDQLEALAGDPNWFKPGSRIIITTRDEQVLVAQRVNLILDVSLLLHNEAFCLFSMYAFGREIPIQGYTDLAEQVVGYAAGLPLTIKVLGSYLCGKNELEWIDVLERLKKIPLKETLEKLEISYIGLEKDQKEIFLDVACFMIWWEKEKAIKVLESCGYHARNGLRVLEQKSLITFLYRNEFVIMHDHISEMGRNIVRRLDPDEPHRHSRLWIEEEIEDILVNDKGTKATRCIQLQGETIDPKIVMKGLGNMKELRFLDVHHDHFRDFSFGYLMDDSSWQFDEVSQYLPNALRYINWYDYPFRCLPKTFQANNLVRLEMRSSGMERLWEGGERKVLKKLRFLDLCYSNLLRTLDLTLTPNLEMLNLRQCEDLVELYNPDGLLNLKSLEVDYSKLRYLDLRCSPNLETLSLIGCRDLVELHMPNECLKLKSINLNSSKLRYINLGLTPVLETLSLTGCFDLIELHIPFRCPNLKSLNLYCSNLRTLDLGMISDLETLSVEGLDMIEFDMPFRCPNLKSLRLKDSKLRYLGIGLTPDLETLTFIGCYDLVELHMPLGCPNLKHLSLRNSKLRTLDLGLTPNIEKLDLRECYDLKEVHAPIGFLKKLFYFDLFGCSRLESFVLKNYVESHEVSSLSELHLIVDSKNTCPLPYSNFFKKFRVKFFYKEHPPSSFGNLEKLISSGLCVCTNDGSFSLSICSSRFIKKLTLEGNIPEIPEGLNQLECLEEIILLYTGSKHFPDSNCMLKYLKALKLKCCWHLEKLPGNLGQLESLEKLTLTSSKIKNLPDSICTLKNLKTLELISCWLLEKLPDDLGRLECLEELTLSSSKIKNLPDSICMLKHLKTFELKSCWFLEKLPDDLGRLECLEELILAECIILRNIPNSICEIKNLKYLHLPYCLLVDKLPEELGHLKCLKGLDIEGTGISHLPQSIFLLKGLYIVASTWRILSYGFTPLRHTSEHRGSFYIWA